MHVTLTTTIPLEGKLCTDASGYRRLICFYNACLKHSNCAVFIDLTNLVWIDANLSALLQSILYKLNKDNGLIFTFDVDLVARKFSILFRNGLLSSVVSLPDGAGSTVRAASFYPHEDEAFYNYIDGELLGHSQMEQHKCAELLDYYFEVFSNVQKHASTHDPIFVCGQFYPKSKKLFFTIVDLGIGFLPAISKYTDGLISTAEQAIKWAVKYGSTSKGKEEPGGTGLARLLEHCEGNGGYFNIATGDAYWGNNLGELGTRAVPTFTGTTIHLIYNCQ